MFSFFFYPSHSFSRKTASDVALRLCCPIKVAIALLPFLLTKNYSMNWNDLISSQRFGKENAALHHTEKRSVFQRDYDRLIFSAPFRRLQNKTQVFPLPGSIFVHNRLTHSLEVSSVGRSLGADVAAELIQRHPEVDSTLFYTLPDIVSAACLAHDMGNPPFGHSGERAIRTFFTEGKGLSLREQLPAQVWKDLTFFDGNANTFRLLTHQFHGRRTGGFVMTYSTLASIVKYPYSSTLATKEKFGFFASEQEGYERVAKALGIPLLETAAGGVRYARHPLVYLVEAADDICYQIMDIEDAYKLRILSATETEELLLNFFEVQEREDIRAAAREEMDISSQIVYYRAFAIGRLVRACVATFIAHEEEILAGNFQGSLIAALPPTPREAYQKCTQIAVTRIYKSREVRDIELAGYQIIYTLLELMVEAVLYPEKEFSKLLLSQASEQYELRHDDLEVRIMAVIDYLSGMTDVFALDLYRKINGHSLPSV